MTPESQGRLLASLEDLSRQAKVERSHYYTAFVLNEAIAEIKRLQEIEWQYKELCR